MSGNAGAVRIVAESRGLVAHVACGRRSTRAQSATQTYTYSDPFGACYSRQIAATSGVLTSLADGAGCPGGENRLYWWDGFHNYASSVAGNTVQLLP
jgi:hypothetical protein